MRVGRARGPRVKVAAQLREWPPRRWLASGAGTIATGLLIGVPTRLVPTPLFSRMVPVAWWAWPIWASAAVIGGLLLATYVRVPAATGTADTSRTAVAGGVLSVFAVGCPVCNKLVVIAIGVTGALKVFAPLQPLLGLASLALLGWSLRVRLRGEIACAVPRSNQVD
jgi:hypothetical protein